MSTGQAGVRQVVRWDWEPGMWAGRKHAMKASTDGWAMMASTGG